MTTPRKGEMSAAERIKYDAHNHAMRLEERRRAKVFAEWEKRWKKGQDYSIKESVDDGGDVLWIAKGKGEAISSYSIERIRAWLSERGIEYETVRWEPAVYPGDYPPHDGSDD